jgi:hypothetical protein
MGANWVVLVWEVPTKLMFDLKMFVISGKTENENPVHLKTLCVVKELCNALIKSPMRPPSGYI